MYLYVPFRESETELLQGLPDGLKNLTGQLEKVMELELSPDRKLARVSVEEVMTALENQGYYLQMPPSEQLKKDDSMLHNPSDSF